ncbi:MAG: amidohydrolase family protein [Alteromonadaceae bacterium]|nr:amidohydrolase family protein [Alteromonadaceae bacterium]MBL4910341.1 amidohydrolase family protein [Alteromonadaceae bacterium]
MKNIIFTILLLLLDFFTTNYAHAKSTLYYNINGYTLNEKGTLIQFNAIQFNKDKIERIFKTDKQLPNNKKLIKINGHGKTMLPGLIDAHGHVLSYGLSLLQVDLTATTSEQAAVKRALKFSRENPLRANDWLLGRGWNQVLWQGKHFPQAINLDEYFKNTPIWFKRIDGHAGWANTKAMALAGVSNQTLTPAGGEIIKDKNGDPTGVFVDNAMALITDKIPPLSQQQIQFALVKAMKSLASVGLTSVHDAGISNDNIKAYKSLVAAHNMPIRIDAMIDINDKHIKELLKQGYFRSKDDKFIINSVKISADGALGSRGAALIKDYSDQHGNKGLLLYTPEKLDLLIKTVLDAGFQVNTHAIGDRANKIILDLYEKHITDVHKKALRNRIEHAQVLRLEDIPRFAKLGVIASMQATHATSDKNMAQDRLGKKRILGAYAWHKLLASGAVIAGGSDFPIESPNPFYGLHAAVTRQDKQNTPQNGWFAEEDMTLAQAFKSFTIDAAYAGHQEKIIGSLEEGKKADFILIDQDVFSINAKEIWKTQVLETWVSGKKVVID